MSQTSPSIDIDDSSGEDAVDDSRLTVLSVVLDGNPAALEAAYVGSMVEPPRVTPVPKTTPSVLGVARIGGRTAVVIDARILYGGVDPEAVTLDDGVQLLVLDRGSATPIALVVDEFVESTAVPVERITLDPAGDDTAALAAIPELTAAVIEPEEGDDSVPTPILDVEAAVDTARSGRYTPLERNRSQTSTD